MIQRISQAKVGNSVLKAWVGEDAKPVPQEQAQLRANICRNCPKNDSGEWLWKLAAQLLINARYKVMREMNLRVEGESELHTCEVCGCLLRQKIFVPLKHILKYTSPDMLSRYPDWCWLRIEKPTT